MLEALDHRTTLNLLISIHRFLALLFSNLLNISTRAYALRDRRQTPPSPPHQVFFISYFFFLILERKLGTLIHLKRQTPQSHKPPPPKMGVYQAGT